MTCTAPDVDLYALGQLDAAEAAALEEHLLTCQRCREELDVAVSFMRAMRSRPGRAKARKVKDAGKITG